MHAAGATLRAERIRQSESAGRMQRARTVYTGLQLTYLYSPTVRVPSGDSVAAPGACVSAGRVVHSALPCIEGMWCGRVESRDTTVCVPSVSSAYCAVLIVVHATCTELPCEIVTGDTVTRVSSPSVSSMCVCVCVCCGPERNEPAWYLRAKCACAERKRCAVRTQRIRIRPIRRVCACGACVCAAQLTGTGGVRRSPAESCAVMQQHPTRVRG